MSDNFQKFLLLGVVGVSVAFSQSGLMSAITRSAPLRDGENIVSEGAVVFSSHAFSADRFGKNIEEIPETSISQEEIKEKSEILQETPSLAALLPNETIGETAKYPSIAEPPKELKVHAALLGALDGKDYFLLRAEGRWPLASLTKLMTAVIALETLSLEAEGRSLPNGERYRVRDLIRLMLIASDNDAADALAATYGTSAFLERMNARASAWGMNETHFSDPSGLSVANQSTAQDIKRMVSKIQENYPEILRTTRDSEVVITDLVSGGTKRVLANNQFAGKEGFLGGKTGFTDEAKGNLVSLFTKGGAPVVIVVLGTERRFEETEKLWDWFSRLPESETL